MFGKGRRKGMQISNGEITSTFLGFDDHGILTFALVVEGDGWGVSIGSYALDEYDKKIGGRIPHPKSMSVIAEILNVVGVKKWEDLKGEFIRIEDYGPGRQVFKIGNLIENRWLDFSEFFKEWVH